MRLRRSLGALGLAAAVTLALPWPVDPAHAGDRAEPALTSEEQEFLDRVILYMLSPEHCDRALEEAVLTRWIQDLLPQRGIAPRAAAIYLGKNELRLRKIAIATFEGRQGKEACDVVFGQRYGIAAGTPYPAHLPDPDPLAWPGPRARPDRPPEEPSFRVRPRRQMPFVVPNGNRGPKRNQWL